MPAATKPAASLRRRLSTVAAAQDQDRRAINGAHHWQQQCGPVFQARGAERHPRPLASTMD
jgi:hypothetical protein